MKLILSNAVAALFIFSPGAFAQQGDMSEGTKSPQNPTVDAKQLNRKGVMYKSHKNKKHKKPGNETPPTDQTDSQKSQ